MNRIRIIRDDRPVLLDGPFTAPALVAGAVRRALPVLAGGRSRIRASDLYAFDAAEATLMDGARAVTQVTILRSPRS